MWCIGLEKVFILQTLRLPAVPRVGSFNSRDIPQGVSKNAHNQKFWLEKLQNERYKKKNETSLILSILFSSKCEFLACKSLLKESTYFETCFYIFSQFFSCGQLSYFWHWICGVYWPPYFGYDKNCAWQCNIAGRHETRRWQQPFFQTWPSFGNKRLFLGGRKEGAVFALGGTGRLLLPLPQKTNRSATKVIAPAFHGFHVVKTYHLHKKKNHWDYFLNLNLFIFVHKQIQIQIQTIQHQYLDIFLLKKWIFAPKMKFFGGFFGAKVQT